MHLGKRQSHSLAPLSLPLSCDMWLSLDRSTGLHPGQQQWLLSEGHEKHVGDTPDPECAATFPPPCSWPRLPVLSERKQCSQHVKYLLQKGAIYKQIKNTLATDYSHNNLCYEKHSQDPNKQVTCNPATSGWWDGNVTSPRVPMLLLPFTTRSSEPQGKAAGEDSISPT
jgi:hypothetical protein